MRTHVPPTTPAESRFRSLVDRLGAIVWEALPGHGSQEAVFTFVSEGTEALLGHPADSWTADPRFWSRILHPEDRDRVFAQVGEAVRAGHGGDFECRMLAADERTVWVRVILHPDRLDDGTVVVRGVIVDVTARREADARLQRLQRLTDALSGVLDAREMAAIVASQGRAAVGAVAVAVFIRHGDELEISGYDGYPEEAIREFCSIPIDRDVPAAEAARTGRSILLDPAAFDARYPHGTRFRKLAGSGQLVAIPLSLKGETFGALAIRMPGDRPVGDADRVVLDVLARTCAQALQRASIVAAERAAKAVLDTVINTAPEGFALFDTDLRYVRVNDRLAEINGISAADHIGRTLQEVVAGVPEDGRDSALRRVLETGEPVVDLEVTGYTPAAPDRRCTWLVSYFPVPGADGAVQFLGAFVIDITARKEAERRASVLAELGPILDEVVGVEDRLRRLVDALVPAVADVCSVSLRQSDGSLGRVAIRHRHPDGEAALAALPPATVPVGVTQVIEDVTDEDWRRYGFGPEQRDLQHRHGIRSAVVAPMVVRGRDVGVLAVASLRPHAFAPADVELAQEVARRAALAVDNAQLYESERSARDRTARQYAVATALADALTADDVADAILSEVIPAIGAESATVWQVTEDGREIEMIGSRGFDRAVLAGHERYMLREPRPVADAIRARRPLWFETGPELAAAYPAFAEGFARTRLESAAVFPLLSAGRAVGGLWISSQTPRAFDEDDRALAAALAAQAAQALERARLFEAERRVSVTLQRSLLPARLPRVDGVEVAVRYLPAAGLEAGGDFYEALPLPDGAIGFAVGDVVGRGAAAAAAMGQLRSALRAFALVGAGPADVLGHLSAFAETVGGALASTAVVARLDPRSGALRYACAGHPWPLLVQPDGRAEYLTGGRGVPLGCVRDPAFEEDVAHLAAGATLLLYTDGLTERRGEPMDAALKRLRLAAAETAGASLTDLVDRVLARSIADAPADDVALVAVRLSPDPAPAPLRLRLPASIREVPGARAATREWLARAGADPAAASDLLLATGEAVANAVEHSGTRDVDLELRSAGAGWVEVVVRDHGSWRTPVIAEHRGRGMRLMEALVAEAAIEHGEGGTTVRLRHRIAGAAAPAPASAPAETECRLELEGPVARIVGDLALECTAEIRRRLTEARPSVVDLTATTFVDSTGARMLIELGTALGRRVTVVAPPGGAPRRALDLGGLGKLLDVRDA